MPRPESDRLSAAAGASLLERLMLVQEAAGVGVFDDDLAEAHIEWDERMRAIWGVPLDQPITRDLFTNSILPDDRAMVEAAFQAACDPQGSRRFACEYRIRSQADGAIRHVAVTGLVTIRDGQAQRLVGSARDVSQARTAEAARAEALALAQGLLATAPTLIYIFDLVEQRNVYLSPQSIEILGLTQTDVGAFGRDLMASLMHTEDLDRIAAHHARIRSGSVTPPFEIEYRMRHRDGHHVWLASKEVVHRRDAEGRPTQILGASLDMTARRAAEESARANARLLQAVVDAVPSLVFVKDLEGRYLLANNETLQAIGRPWSEVEGRTDDGWTEPDQLAPIREADRRVIATGVPMEAEEQFHHDDVGPRTFLSRKTPLVDEEGRVTGLVGSAIEVTDRVRAASNLAASEARLRRVLDQLFAFVGVASPDGTLLWANRAPLQLAGLAEADVVGRPFWATHWWSYSAEAQARVQDAMQRAATGETVRFDIPVLFTTEQPMTIDFQVAPLFDEGGKVENLIPSGILIEDRVQAEHARELLIGELHHRIKNLYAIASGMVQRSARGAPDMESLVKSVCGRMTAMAQAHDLIRPTEAGSQGPILLHHLLSRILPQHAETPDQIRLDGPAVALQGEAATPLALIFHELATNAAKYGALSVAGGRIDIGWHCAEGRLGLPWQEIGGPPVQHPPERQGFGSRLMRASTEQQLRGTIRQDWSDTGCRVVLDLPDRWVCR